MPTLTPPSGPRTSRPSGRISSTRQVSRGGIQKRSGNVVRTDKDGDLVMDATAAARGAGNNSNGRGVSIRGSANTRRHGTPDLSNGTSKSNSKPTRRGIDPFSIQKTVLRSMGADASLRGSRMDTRSLKRRAHEERGGSESIRVIGLKESNAAKNQDGGIAALVSFLERKATERKSSHSTAPPREPVKILKSHLEGDALVILVRSEDTSSIMKLDDFEFARSKLKIQTTKRDPERREGQKEDWEASNTLEMLKSVLSRRYNPDTKLLDLSQLGSDPDLVHIGMFNSDSTGSKFFPALMKVCDSTFKTAQEKEQAITSVSLANNALQDLATVTTLAPTFPSLNNLDLSNNQFKNLGAIDVWRRRFPKLEHLVLTGNPLENNEPNYKSDIMRWYPSLRMLNNEQVRTSEEVTSAAKIRLPIPVLGPSFRDEASISENFLTQFFPAYDADRTAVANGYYDANSQFSLSINMTAVRDRSTPVASWEQYTKRSRNLTRLSHTSAQMSRLNTGVESIREAITSLPVTRHPGLLTEPEKWCIECHTIPGLPDPTGQSPSGVGGLIVMVHGEFDEIDVSTDKPTATRSFDRTFILGPGAGIGGIRVASDMLVLRAHGGHDAWKPDQIVTTSATLPINPPATSGPVTGPPYTVTLEPGFGVAAPDKPEEQTMKETMAVELSTATGMTIAYSGLALDGNGWNLQQAAQAFQEYKATLPPDAFLPGVRPQ